MSDPSDYDQLLRSVRCSIGLTKRPTIPLIADHHNFYKVEKWTKDGSKVDHMLYAGSSLDKARDDLRRSGQVSAAYPDDYPAADAGVGAVAGAKIPFAVRMDPKALEPRSANAPGVPELRLKLGS